jgi:hypothetical protein
MSNTSPQGHFMSGSTACPVRSWAAQAAFRHPTVRSNLFDRAMPEIGLGAL